MKTFWLFSCVALLLQTAPQSSATGTVQGTITRAGSAEPLGDVQVRLLPRGLPPGLPPEIQLQLSPGRSAVSDNMGRFVFRDVPAGIYTLIVQREGFSQANASFVTVAADKTSDVSLTLIPGGIIRGRVLDSAGQFLSNATVQAFFLVYQNGIPILQAGVSKATDDRGEYRLFGVPPGDYYVGVTPRAPIANTAPSSGTIRNVRTFHPSTTTTSSATRVTLHSGDEIFGIDIAVQSRLQVLVSGKVASEVPPLPPNTDAPGVFATISNTQNNSANLFLAPRDASVAEDSGTRLGNAVLLNASQGEFRIQNVVAGSYDLFAFVNSPQGFAVGRTPVDVIDRDITGLTVVVKPGVEVTGTISANGNIGNSPNLRLGLQPLDGLIRVIGGLGAQSQTAETGTFSFPSVPEGRFRVTAATFGNLYIEDILQNGVSVYDSGFEVHFGSSPDPLQVVVKPGAGAVEGIVADAAGKSLAGATVALVPNLRRTNVNLYRNATSDAAGKFNLNGVTPGDYKLFAWPGAINGAYFNAEFLARYEDQGRAITVTPDSRINAGVSAFHSEGR